MKKIKFELVNNYKDFGNPILPERKTASSAGYDFFLPKDIDIKSGEKTGVIFTGIKAFMPNDIFLSLHIRSSLAIKKGLRLANITGIIDADYYNNPDNEGNIGIILINDGSEDVSLKAGERVAQGIFTKYFITEDDATDSSRTGGFGSTDN